MAEVIPSIYFTCLTILMKVTKLEYQKNDPGRVSVYVDDKFLTGIEESAVITLSLYKDKEITQEELNTIIDSSEFGKLFNASLNFLSFRPRSEFEIRQFLKRRLKNEEVARQRSKKKPSSVPPSPEIEAAPDLNKSIDEVITRLRQIGQIDDSAFANWFIDQRKTYKPKGKLALRQELLVKGIDRKTAEKTISTSGEGASEFELALRAVDKKVRLLSPRIKDQKSFLEIKLKLQRFLISRGFSWDTIPAVLDKTLGKRYTKTN